MQDKMIMRGLSRIKAMYGIKKKFDFDEYKEAVEEISNTIKLMVANQSITPDLETKIENDERITVLEAELPMLPVIAVGRFKIKPNVDLRGVLKNWQISIADTIAFVVSSDELLDIRKGLLESFESKDSRNVDIELHHGKEFVNE